MSTEVVPIQVDPVFDPARVGASIDVIQGRLPLRAPWLRGNVVGEMASKIRGEGYDIDGVRPYVLGDDPRHIDYNITARQPDQWPQLRERYADITPNMYIVTDVLQSRYGFNPGYYSEQNLALAAVMAFMRIARVENMPVAIFGSNDESIFGQQKPAQGKLHSLKSGKFLTSHLLVPNEYGQSMEVTPPLSSLLRYAGRWCVESVVIVVSDFRDTAEPTDPDNGWKPALDRLAHQGNNLIAVELTNPWDYELPPQADRLTTKHGVAWIGGGKLGRQRRADYAEAASLQQSSIDAALAVAGAVHIKLATDQPRWITSFRDQIK